MSEVEKMYENAGIQKQYCGWLNIGDLDTNVQYVRCATKEKYDNYAALDSSDLVQIIPDEVYPSFTAEKQLELIKWLGELDLLEIMRTTRDTKEWIINSEYGMSGNVYKYSSRAKTFEETLAKLINSLWQDLTEQERTEIAEILKG